MKALALMAALGALAVSGQSPALSAEAGKLVVWINGDKGHRGLAEVGKRFEADTGIPVVVEYPDAPTDKFQQAASTGGGPDIFFWPHDRLGEWANAGLLVPVDPGEEIRADVLPMAWDAFTHDGRQWGYPISVEAIGLIHNKDLVAEPPNAFEDLPGLAEQLAPRDVKPIMWAYNTPYFSWPMLAANGAEAYPRTPDGYDTKATGVNSESAVEGAGMILSLIEGGVMPKGVTYSVMEAAMINREIAMMISGPWAWENLRRNGIDFAVAPLPTVDGAPAKPYVGVLGAMISSASPNRDLAVEFLENYVLQPDGLRTIDRDVPIGVPASKTYFEELKDRPEIVATMANVEAGTPMPNVPEMAKFWAAMETALGNITSGRQPVREALDAAAARILN